jgi:hypothetical protein
MSALRYYTSPDNERQGDKIEQNFAFAGYKRFFIYLQKGKIPHKFVPKLSLLRQMEQQPGQEGKFLTIYPKGESEMLSVISKADKYLIEMNFCGCFNASKGHVGIEKRVGTLGIVTVRYGSFVDPWVMKPASQITNLDPDDISTWAMKDPRSTQYKPDHIRDPWTKQPATGEKGWHHHPGFQHG